MKPENRLVLRLSPNVRLRMTVEREMWLDKDETIFNKALHEKYLTMHKIALERQDNLLKSLAIADALLVMLLFGKNVTIPGTSIGIQDLPAAVEVLTIFASFSFMFLCLAFTNLQAYQAILHHFSIRDAVKRNIDPDFLLAADTYQELFLKLFRPKMNLSGIDFFDPGRGYKVFYTTLIHIMTLAIYSVLLLHISIVGYATWTTFALNWISVIFCAAVILTTLVAILVSIAPAFAFTVKDAPS